MEIGLPANTPSAPTSTGINQGFAQVLDTSSFDPIAFVQNMNKEREAKELAKAKAQLDYRAKWDKVGTPKVDYITSYNQKEIEGDLDNYSTIIADAYMQGLDPNDYKVKDQLLRVENDIRRKEGESKKIDEIVKANATVAKDFPPEVWQEWMKGLEMQPSVEARLKYATENNPFQEPIDVNEILNDVIDPENLRVITEKMLGGGYTKVEGKTLDKDIEEVLKYNLYQNPAYKDKIDKFYKDNLGKEGYFNNPDEFEAYMLKSARTKALKDFDKIEGSAKSPSGSSNANAFVGANVFGDVAVNPAGVKPTEESDVKFSEAQLVEKGKTVNGIADIAKTSLAGEGDTNAIFALAYDQNKPLNNGTFVTVDGASINGRPTQFKFSQDGTLWAVLEDSYIPVDVNTSVITDKEVQNKAKANQEQLARSFGIKGDLQALLSYIYGQKRVGKATPVASGKTTTTTTEAEGDSIFK